MAFEWPKPWRVVPDRWRTYIGGELSWELSHFPDHPLSGQSFTVVAMMDPYDNAIVRLEDGGFGYVRLTWGQLPPHFEPIGYQASLSPFLRRIAESVPEPRSAFSDIRVIGVPEPRANVIAVLEDDPGRTSAMKAALGSALPEADVVFFDNAPDMIAWLTSNLSSVALLCLDHDLGPKRDRNGARFDPGIGRDVVDFLITRAPACSVIIHSTNSIGANGMVTALEEAFWTAERVVPYNDLAWVTERWNERVLFHIKGV